MKKSVGLLTIGVFLLTALGTVAAQTMDTTPPPKVLVIFREFEKPGKTGSTHEKSESAFVQALTRAKWPTHYLAVDSLTGKTRSLFLTGYDSFEAWEKDYMAMQKNPALAAAFDRAAAADGELLSETDGAVLTYREDQSLRANVDIAHMRYFEIALFQVKPGHRHEWDELVKLVTAAYEKIPEAHWATYEIDYGQQPSGTYAVFTALKSTSEIDQEFTHDKDFVAAMGEDGMKKLAELEASAIETSQTNLFSFNPKMSYPSEDWVKADPDFWKPKAAAPMAPKKPAEKPAAQ
ncbi:MAG TPA: hypothetical protein VMH85_17450 [Terriglobales bacterium]|nr:hypothetical protein [Terriglobales bacterium]